MARLGRSIGLALLVLGWVVGLAVGPSWGQDRPSPAASPSPSPGAAVALPGVSPQWQRNWSDIQGLLYSPLNEANRGSVYLDGRRLFTIAAPSTPTQPAANAKPDDSPAPIDRRTEIIEDRLNRIVERNFEPKTLEVTAELDSSSQQPIVYVTYATDRTEYRDELLTVTALDAEINGTEPINWSEELTILVREALLRAHDERQPDYLIRQSWITLLILGGLAIASLVIQRLIRRLHLESRALAAQAKQVQVQTVQPPVAIRPDDPERSTDAHSPQTTTALLQQQVKTQQRRGFNEIQRRLWQLLLLLLCGGSAYVILGLFAQSRWLRLVLVRWVQIPLRLMAIALITYIAVQISVVLVDRLFWVLQSGTSLAALPSQRIMLRFTTFSRVAKSVAVLICISIGLIAAIATLGIQISPTLLAGAGIIGVGVSLASQNLMRDIINGFLILLEDQFGVGDVIIVGDVSGVVENMNLRITQLRNEEGRLITIPNSSIAVVQNLSKEWSRVDLSISVAYNADLEQSLDVVEQVAKGMTEEEPWKNLILESPLLLGVDKLDSTGATIRLWIKTQPLKQWEVAREYRRRLKLAFDQLDIPIGIPQQFLQFGASPDEATATQAAPPKLPPGIDRPAPRPPSSDQNGRPS